MHKENSRIKKRKSVNFDVIDNVFVYRFLQRYEKNKKKTTFCGKNRLFS